MIEKLITYLNTLLAATNYFERNYCLSEYVEQDDKRFPAQYQSNGQYENIGYDTLNGLSYFVKNGDVAISQADNVAVVGKPALNISIPLKLVCFINKSELSNDNNYSDDLLAQTIIKAITQNTNVLKSNIKARNVSILATRYKTDKNKIADDEFDNINFNPRFEYSYISIELEANIVIGADCIETDCEIVYPEFPIPQGKVYITCDDLNDCNTIIDIIERIVALEQGGDLNCEALSDCQIIQTIQNNINDLDDALGTEITNRENADNTLQTNIENEAQTRQLADEDLQDQIDDINTDLSNYQLKSEKGQANGYASLDSGGKVPQTQIPASAITDTFVVNSQSAMLALNVETGDVCVRTDLNKSFILQGSNPTILSNWQELLTPTDTVLSVNGQIGAVVLGATDVDALKRDGSNANSDIDIGAYSLNAKHFKVNGTAGAGHVSYKHQSSNATAAANETSVFAGSDGEMYYKNDGNAVVQFASQAWVNLQGFITNVITALGYTPENVANKGMANGYVPLNASTKIDLTYFPDAILGQVLYGGLVDISTAVATLTTNAKNKLGTLLSTITLTNNTAALTGYGANEGIYYIASVGGTFAGISFDVGDWLISIGTAWKKVDNTDAVVSVNGQTGAVTLTTSDISEGTNLYFTNARAIASLLTGYVSGAGTISSSDSILQAIQKLNGNIGALITGVSSVNGQTGTVTLTTTNISEGTNLYFTNARGIASTLTGYTSGAGTISATDTILQSIQKLNGNTAIITGAATQASRLRSAAIALTSGTTANVTSITLAAGTWDISGGVGFVTTGGLSATTVHIWGISLTSATLPATDTSVVPTSGEVRYGVAFSFAIAASSANTYAISQYRVVLGASTTLYLVASANFSTNGQSAFGSITAIPVK